MTEAGKTFEGSVALRSGRLIAKRRKALGMPQVALARQLGVAQSTVADWERGATRPRIPLWERLASALHCDLRDIMPDFQQGYLDGEDESSRRTINHRNHLEHAFLYALDELNKIRIEYKEYHESHSMYFGGVGFVSGEREAALLAFRICMDAVDSHGEQPIVGLVEQRIKDYRLGISQIMDVLRTFDEKAGKSV